QAGDAIDVNAGFSQRAGNDFKRSKSASVPAELSALRRPVFANEYYCQMMSVTLLEVGYTLRLRVGEYALVGAGRARIIAKPGRYGSRAIDHGGPLSCVSRSHRALSRIPPAR